MYKFSGFTVKANNAINYAIIIAEQLGHTYVGSEHLLLGLLRESGGTAAAVLSRRGLNYDRAYKSVIQTIGRGVLSVLSPGDFSPNMKKIIDAAATECRAAGAVTADTEHLLLALLGCTGSFGCRWLNASGLDKAAAARLIAESGAGDEERRRGQPPMNPPLPPRAQRAAGVRTATLDKFGRDLTEMAAAGRLDPVVGREREIERVIQILTRRTKNNPCLIGETGVGKTAIVEGLAQRISTGKAPESLLGRRIVSVDLTAMVSGTKYRGDFEERVRAMMEEVGNAGNIILFIDELHTIMGVGAAEGAVDAANMMKPQLARGGFQVVGATTIDEYRKTIERDGALERRFQKVMVDEPSPADAVSIIKGLRDRYELHHQITITDEAIEAAVELSRRYDTGRFLPDKAIDLIDEAASAMRLHSPESKKRELRMSKDDIARVIAQATGIDMSRITEEESKRYIRLEEDLRRSLIGQQEAVAKVGRALRRGRAGLKDPRRPIGSFLLLGPTGVGKTHLCRVLAQQLFGDAESIIKLDMSEYMERHSISRLVGAPPGYIGHDEGGQLTERIRRKPYSIVLFDEIEKAHPDVYNLLLQILEDGELTDARGRKSFFGNTIIMLTGNIGAGRGVSLGFGTAPDSRIMEQLKEHFRPELLNRLDDVLVFNPLGRDELANIARLELNKVCNRLRDIGVELKYTDSAVALVVNDGYDPAYGARPLRRSVQRMIEDPVADRLLRGEFKPGAQILCDSDGNNLQITNTTPFIFL